MEQHQRCGGHRRDETALADRAAPDWTQEVQSIVYAVVLLVGCYLVISGDMTTGALVGTSILASRTIAPLTDFGRAVPLAVGEGGEKGSGRPDAAPD